MRFFIGIIFLLTSPNVFGQVSKGVAAIDSLTAVARVQFLACDALEGRYAGSKDAAISAEYIASEFTRMGYKPVVQRFNERGGEMRNIYTVIPGSSDEIIVIGAHYDHLGVDDKGDAFNGADDNASGVAAVLGIGDAIKASGLTPKRTIILALWDGEESGKNRERGLNGSRFFTQNFEQIKNVVFYMNFDMIGRNTDESKPTLFRYFYNDTKPQYRSYLETAITDFDLNLSPDFRPWDNPTSGSDNANFARIGIPIAWYHTDGHADYHKVSDTSDKLNWSKMLDIIKSSYLVSWQVANE